MRIFTSALCAIIFAGCLNGNVSSASSPAPSPSARPAYTLLYSFKGGMDGAQPAPGLAVLNGRLFGDTRLGGSRSGAGYGVVFEVTTAGTERVVYRFKNGKNTGYATSGLIALNGALYGTRNLDGNGSVYEVKPGGEERVLYRFAGGADGSVAGEGVVAMNGKLYGTTVDGGPSNAGTIFEVTRAGKKRVLYNFQNGTDGKDPIGRLVALNGALYGTTLTGGHGGAGPHGLDSGYGTVFELSMAGQMRVLHHFAPLADGEGAENELLALNGKIYGTTPEGGLGATPSPYGDTTHNGTVFEVTTAGAERVLHRFSAYRDGAYPSGGLVALNGMLYGTTYHGGTLCDQGCGTIYAMSTTGQERILYQFAGKPDGQNPVGTMSVFGGRLYGVTEGGGSTGNGTVFAFSPPAAR
jgi:uncharacterized repeat protein (TIGR03803 family)